MLDYKDDLDGSDLLLPKLTAQTILADKGYDVDRRVIEPLIASREYDKD